MPEPATTEAYRSPVSVNTPFKRRAVTASRRTRNSRNTRAACIDAGKRRREHHDRNLEEVTTKPGSAIAHDASIATSSSAKVSQMASQHAGDCAPRLGRFGFLDDDHRDDE
jgi:hypothetical protein